MIDFQSQLTGMAKLPFLNENSAAGMSSPGGAETGSSEHGERHFLYCSFVGELNHRGRQHALIKVGRAYSRAVLKSFSVSSVTLWQKSVSIGVSTEAFLPSAVSLRPYSVADYREEWRGWGRRWMSIRLPRSTWWLKPVFAKRAHFPQGSIPQPSTHLNLLRYFKQL